MKLASPEPGEGAPIHIQLPSKSVAPPEVSVSVDLHSFCYICRSYVPASVHTASSAADYHKCIKSQVSLLRSQVHQIECILSAKDSDASNHDPGLHVPDRCVDSDTTDDGDDCADIRATDDARSFLDSLGLDRDPAPSVVMEPSADVLAAASVYWLTYCSVFSKQVAEDKLAYALGHSFIQHDPSLSQTAVFSLQHSLVHTLQHRDQFLVDQGSRKVHEHSLRRQKLSSISSLPPRDQRAWAASSRYPTGSPGALLAASVLAEWSAELAATVATIIDQPWFKGIVESGCDPPSDTHESFGYVDIFAGTSAWSEGASPFGGFPVGFIEIDTANQSLLKHFYPHAWVCGDYYAEEWRQHPADEVDVVVAWPMCKHLSRAGLRRMQTDDCASQLWDIVSAVDHFRPLLVGIENVVELEEDEATHGLVEKAIHRFETIGYILVAIWRLHDPSLSGYSHRKRAWLIFEPVRVSARLPMFHQPVMDGFVGDLADCLLPIDQVSHLEIKGTRHDDYFRFAWTDVLQPGTVVYVKGLFGDWCVFEQYDSGAVRIRSRDRSRPVFDTVSRLRLSPSRHLHRLTFLHDTAPTIRSGPDPPGNIVLWESRFGVPAARRVHPWEEWTIMQGSTDKLDWLQDHTPYNITRDAGKRVTGGMSHYLGRHFSNRVPLLRAASASPQCISPECEHKSSSVLIVLLHFGSSSAVVDTSCSLLPGFESCSSRESVKALVESFILSSLGWKVDAYLSGESKIGQRIYGCLLLRQRKLPPHLCWKHVVLLEASPVSLAIHSAATRAKEFIGAVPLELHPHFSAGVARSLVSPMVSRKHSASWSRHCHRASDAVAALRSAFKVAVTVETSRSVRVTLLSWVDKIQSFDPDSIPPSLRNRIPAPGGWSKEPFPDVHKAHKTDWLHRSPPQEPFRRRVGGLKELLCSIYPKLQTYIAQLDAWLSGSRCRPEPLACSALDAAEWSHGRVLDLRDLVNGWVRELDYSASTPTKFNLAAFADRLQHYDDQELVSFVVDGVSYKADLPLQFVVLPHLLNILGYDEAVYKQSCKLAGEPYCWAATYDHPPVWPLMALSKGQVAKGPQDCPDPEIRPVDDAGNPHNSRTVLKDSRGDPVHSLNFYADGRDVAPEGTPKRRAARAKWPHENKPTMKHARTANGIIDEGASLCGYCTYNFSADLKMMFNQFMLRPECYRQSCHLFRGGKWVVNYCMTFGIAPSSNIAQRAINMLVHVFLEDFAIIDEPFLAEEERKFPAFAEWRQQRRELGTLQDQLVFMLAYTDDPLWFIAGADRCVRCVKLWSCILHKFGLIPAGPEKHQIGLGVTWNGMVVHGFFSLTIIPERKSLKALSGLVLALSGGMNSADARSLIGLLEHCRHAAGVLTHRLYPMWKALPSEPAAAFKLAGQARVVADAWVALLQSTRGSAISETFEGFDTDAVLLAWSIFSDAALEPPEEAGMGGFLMGSNWHIPLWEGLEGLTIPVLEFLAGCVNLLVLHSMIGSPTDGTPPYWVKWEIDALASHFVLKNDSATEPVMLFIHTEITASAAFKYFFPRLVLCHTFGPSNPADPVSRGRMHEAADLCLSLKCDFIPVTLPTVATALIDRVVEVNRQKQLGHSWLVQDSEPADGGQSFLLSHFSIHEQPCRPVPRRHTTTGLLSSTIAARQHPPVVTLRLSRPVPLRKQACPAPAPQLPNTLRVVPLRKRSAREFDQCTAHDSLSPRPCVLVPTRASKRLAQAAEPLSGVYALADKLSGDMSIYALCPNDPSRLAAMCSAATELLSRSYNLRTVQRDGKNFKRWERYCRSVGTTPWRDDLSAISSTDPQAYQREVVLMVNALIYFYQTITPRPAGSNRTRCKPDSAMNILRAVRRVFKANLIPLMSLAPVTRALHALTRDFMAQFGSAAMIPRRAATFTNELLNLMFVCSGTLQVSPRKQIEWQSFEGLNLLAALAVARSSGMRKSELVSNGDSIALTISSVAWIISGKVVTQPTTQQLKDLTVHDFLVITPPPSKSDQFGVVWGSLPIYIPVRESPGNAARLVAQVLLQRPNATRQEPLFCSSPGVAFTHSFMAKALTAWIVSVGVSAAQANTFTWHSARVFLACSLLAANRDASTTQAMCRWQTADSLRIYACLSPAAYAQHLDAAFAAPVAAIRAAHIPLISSMDMAFGIQQDLAAPA
jgi:hypothetical protein